MSVTIVVRLGFSTDCMAMMMIHHHLLLAECPTPFWQICL